MEVILILFTVIYAVLLTICVIALVKKKDNILLTRFQWVELMSGSFLLGIFLGLIRSNILNLDNGYEGFIILATFFLGWYFVTYWIKNLITIKSPLYIETNLDNDISAYEKKIEDEYHSNSGFSYYIVFILLLAAIILISTLLPYFSSKENKEESLENSTFYLLAFFIIISILIPFINRSKIETSDKYDIYSYTLAFFLFGSVFMYIFAYNYLDMKNTIITTFLVFIWLSMTKALSRYLTAVSTKVSEIKNKN